MGFSLEMYIPRNFIVHSEFTSFITNANLGLMNYVLEVLIHECIATYNTIYKALIIQMCFLETDSYNVK